MMAGMLNPMQSIMRYTMRLTNLYDGWMPSLSMPNTYKVYNHANIQYIEDPWWLVYQIRGRLSHNTYYAVYNVEQLTIDSWLPKCVIVPSILFFYSS